MPSPTAWNSYIAIAGVKHDDTFTGLARFRARYVLSSDIQPITIDGSSAGLNDAYFACLRVTLAYTALDALESTLKIEKHIKFSDANIASGFRAQRNEILRVLVPLGSDAKLRPNERSFLRFMDGEHEDLRPAVYAIRNLMSHGTLTANRLGLDKSKARRRLVHELAEVTLSACDKRFAEFVIQRRG